MGTFRPILMNTAMVQAILAGRKTLTRRVMKPQPVCHFYEANGPKDPAHEECEWIVPDSKFKGEMMGMNSDKTAFWEYCPYGQVGDILWGRETFCQVMLDHAHDLLEGRKENSLFVYKSDVHPDWMEYAKEKYGYKWKPSLFMPRAACRLFLKITDIRVERVQNISREDAIAEGIERDEFHWWKNYINPAEKSCTCPVESFLTLWDSINAKKCPWESNPWVWVITFQKTVL